MIIEYQLTNFCTDLKLVPEGAEILAIDGTECIGICESCNHPVLETDSIQKDEEGVITCFDCFHDLIREG